MTVFLISIIAIMAVILIYKHVENEENIKYVQDLQMQYAELWETYSIVLRENKHLVWSGKEDKQT